MQTVFVNARFKSPGAILRTLLGLGQKGPGVGAKEREGAA